MALKELVALGLLVYVDNLEVHKLTGKHIDNPRRKYYKLSRNGNILLNGFFDLYLQLFKKLTGEFWNIPLIEKLGK